MKHKQSPFVCFNSTGLSVWILCFSLVMLNANDAPSFRDITNTVSVRVFSLIHLKNLTILTSGSPIDTGVEVFLNSHISFKTRNELQMRFLPNAKIEVYSDKKLIHRGNWHSITINSRSQSRIRLGNRIVSPRPYYGSFVIRPFRDRNTGKAEPMVINNVSMSHYIASVVSGEIGSITNSIETLKTQAIISRSYAHHYFRRHSKDNHDLCDSTHCQVYFGDSEVRDLIRKAVSETANTLVTYNGKTVPCYFHSTCGGQTTSPADVWSAEHLRYIVGVKDSGDNGISYCRESPHYQWITRIKVEDLMNALWKGKSGSGPFTFSGWNYESSGRLSEITMRKGNRSRVISGEQFRIAIGRYLGWNRLKSIKLKHSSIGNIVQFRGYGFGHGIGLCLYGAAKMGELGFSARQIIRHYFPNCQLTCY